MTHIMDLGYLLASVQGTGAAIGNMLVDYTHNEDKRYCNLTHCAALSHFFLKRKVAHLQLKMKRMISMVNLIDTFKQRGSSLKQVTS